MCRRMRLLFVLGTAVVVVEAVKSCNVAGACRGVDPLQCTNLNVDCLVDCGGANSCSNSVLECPQRNNGKSCSFRCIGLNSCQNAHFSCGNGGGSCTITCQNIDACKTSTVSGTKSTTCNGGGICP
eukprot:Hpha_TRINITY_DN16332_c5_g1::TRINITY_DN16332_c5_g1_i1::g.60954::m.60954